MLSQPPSNIPPPPEIPLFFRIGPGMLIMGSICVSATLLALADALAFKDLAEGLQSSVFMVVVAMIVMALIQGFLGLLFMAGKRRAWWRSILVLIPAAVISLGSLYGISTLYPHERWARNKLERYLGGPVPASVKNASLDYHCNALGATRWKFDFDLSPEDWARITSYSRYQGRSSEAVVSWGQHIPARASAETGFFQLEYHPHTQRCTFVVMSD